MPDKGQGEMVMVFGTSGCSAAVTIPFPDPPSVIPFSFFFLLYPLLAGKEHASPLILCPESFPLFPQWTLRGYGTILCAVPLLAAPVAAVAVIHGAGTFLPNMPRLEALVALQEALWNHFGPCYRLSHLDFSRCTHFIGHDAWTAHPDNV